MGGGGGAFAGRVSIPLNAMEHIIKQVFHSFQFQIYSYEELILKNQTFFRYFLLV